MINSNNLNGSEVNTTAGALATSDGQLNQTHVAQYNELVRGCLATGSYCIIDIHNYARFEGQVIGQGGPTNEQFANLWSQIANMVNTYSRAPSCRIQQRTWLTSDLSSIKMSPG